MWPYNIVLLSWFLFVILLVSHFPHVVNIAIEIYYTVRLVRIYVATDVLHLYAYDTNIILYVYTMI